jgi:superfamily II DNA or RNA helicase
MMDKLFLLVREMSEPNVWSAGVELARNATFQEEPLGVSGERTFRVVQGRRDAIVSVALSEANEIWQCDCSLEEDPCRHVVATILAVKQGKLSHAGVGAERKVVSGVSHEFSRSGGTLRFDRFLLCGDVAHGGAKIPVAISLLQSVAAAKRDGYVVMPNDAELKIDHVLPQSRQGVLDPKTMRFLLPALSRVPLVMLDGERVSVHAEPIPVVVEVVDEGAGFRVRRARADGVTEIFDNGVAICDGALRAIEDSALRMEEVEILRGDGSIFPASAGVELATRILPQLQGKVKVQVISKLLPRARRVAARVVIEAVSHDSGSSVTIVPRLVYGDPVIAEVRSGALELVDPREIPIREVAEEGRLVRELSLRTGLRFDQAHVYSGEAAIECVHRLRGWQVFGDGLSRFTPLGELSARAQIENGALSFSFVGADSPEREYGTSSSKVLAAWRRGASYVQLEGAGGWAKLPREWLREHGVALERIVAAMGERAQLPGRLVAEVRELCESVQIEPPEYFKRLAQGLAEVDSIPDVELPPDLRADLRAYQRTGVNWISFLHHHGLGALLADDMGLGKTLQALCVVKGRTLVVCPTSVLASWKQQIELFRPALRVSLYHGARRELVDASDVILTSYALLRLDIDRLSEVEWDLVVLDEAQTIRNPSSQVAQAAYRLRAKNRLSLSGTPVENSLDDLWSHFRFLNPGLLGEYREFQQRFVQLIELGQVGPTQELRKRSMPFIMRRLKRDVARELPPKTEVVLECELTHQERVAYEAVLGMVKADVLQALESERGLFSVLEVLLRLRQACCHSGLLPGNEAQTSSKLELLMESLHASRAQGHRALVFSQWTSLLDLIEPHLNERSISFCRIDGTTQGRGDLVDLFQSREGPDVMLLSLKAGGLGLTLTAADHVYIIDPWWNPAAEDQAADRAYRIGQNNPVIVHRLVAKDTIEERILQIQSEKRALLAAAIGESGALSLSREDVLRLLGV